MYRLLRIVRISIEVAVTLLIAVAMIGCGADIERISDWIRHMQVIPASLILSIAVIVFWVAVTLILGRIYCSTICPMGALQDAFARLHIWTNRRHHYNYCPPLYNIRLVWLVIFIGLTIGGATSIALIIDPYSAFTGICKTVIASAWFLSGIKVLGISLIAASVSLLTMFIVAAISWRRGRWLCNIVCPIGTAMGIISKYSALHIEIDTDLCTNCGRCRDACKAECIDLSDHVVDSSRCVVCFDCLTVCHDKAIRYTWHRKQLSWPLMQESIRTSAQSACSGCVDAVSTKSSIKPDTSPKTIKS